MAPVYATPADYRLAYPSVPGDDAALELLLESAELEVDTLLPGYLRLITTGPATGRKVDPSVLAEGERRGLARAVAHQAEHRRRNPNAGLERDVDEVAGPAFRKKYAAAGAGAAGTGLYSTRLLLELEPLLRRIRRGRGPVRARP